MLLEIPRYIEAQPGETPAAYFLEGARLTPLARMAAANEGAPPVRPLAAPPARLAQLGELAAIADKIAAVETVAAVVAAVENGLPLPMANAAPAPASLRAVRSAVADLAAARAAERN